MECGTYLVDDTMVEELRRARRGEHASNLGAVLALRFATAAGVKAYIVDPVTADEWQECARLSGSPLVKRTFIGHALNTKAAERGAHGQWGDRDGTPQWAHDRQQLHRRRPVRAGSDGIAAGAGADQVVL
jgi:butyrate kinase